MAQIQCGLLVTGRQWCDYVSICGGMPLYIKRVEADARWHEAITDAAANFYELAQGMQHIYRTRVEGLTLMERIDHDMEIRSEEHTSELQSLMRISYAVLCLKKTKKQIASDRR